jgi:hypothetical protein
MTNPQPISTATLKAITAGLTATLWGIPQREGDPQGLILEDRRQSPELTASAPF